MSDSDGIRIYASRVGWGLLRSNPVEINSQQLSPFSQRTAPPVGLPSVTNSTTTMPARGENLFAPPTQHFSNHLISTNSEQDVVQNDIQVNWKVTQRRITFSQPLGDRASCATLSGPIQPHPLPLQHLPPTSSPNSEQDVLQNDIQVNWTVTQRRITFSQPLADPASYPTLSGPIQPHPLPLQHLPPTSSPNSEQDVLQKMTQRRITFS